MEIRFMLIHKLLKETTRLAAVSVMVSSASLVSAMDEPFQQLPVVLVASDFLPKSMLSGEGYTVNERVTNDGFQNTYSMKTDYGVLTVASTDELRARIQEVKATRALEKLERSEEFKEAAKGAVTGMVEGGKALVTAPVDTTKKAVKGVGRWLGNVGRSITSDDPHQDNVLKTVLGYDAAKRAYAIEMGVDPYTDFEPFQERLGEVARSATAGGLVTSVAIDVGTEGTLAGTLVTVTSLASMKKILKDNPPGTLTRINREKLLEMGIKGYQADALLKNYNYTPAELTIMVEALKRMGDIKGREIFAAFATAAPDRQIARFMQHYAEMLADYITTVEAGDIVDISGEAWLVSRSGSLVGAFPIDYLAWTEELAGSAGIASDQSAEHEIRRKELLLEGQVSPQARSALVNRGWKITENVRLASAEKSAKGKGGAAVSPGAKGASQVIK
jgi:hypothetical protein